MFKRMVGIGIGFVLALSSCGGDDSGESADAAVEEMANTGDPSSGGTAASDMSMTGTTGGSGGAPANTPPANAGDAGMMPGQPPASDDDGLPPAQEGAMYGPCESDEDCAGDLNCYEFGGYCSQACGADEDCAGLGDSFDCSGIFGGGGFPGGGGPGGVPGGGMADAGPADDGMAQNGVCRAACEGEDDTSCPGGLTCIAAGGGGGFMGGGGTFRCGIAAADDEGGDMNAGSGTTPAFGECSDDGDCADGLSCTAGGRRGGGGSGYCTQECEEDTDCTAQASGGTAAPTCGFGGSCALSCADDEGSCPDGMTCNAFGGGGGGGGFAFCNY